MANPIPATDLDAQYRAIIESHEQYLSRLQKAFDEQCDKIGDETKTKLAQTAENDDETRQKILEAEKAELDRTLAELKAVVNKANAQTRKRLESIDQKRDATALDLDAELAKIEMNKKKK
jgi:hypothetical protein